MAPSEYQAVIWTDEDEAHAANQLIDGVEAELEAARAEAEPRHEYVAALEVVARNLREYGSVS